MKMKPFIGALVVVVLASASAEAFGYSAGRELPAIVTQVNSEESVNVSIIGENGLHSIVSVTMGGLNVDVWKWGELDLPAHSETLHGVPASIDESPLGAGFNPLSWLGGFKGIIVPLIMSIYMQNRGSLETAADRALTPPEDAIKQICRILKIEGESDVAELVAAAHVWGDAGGDFLVLLGEKAAQL